VCITLQLWGGSVITTVQVFTCCLKETYHLRTTLNIGVIFGFQIPRSSGENRIFLALCGVVLLMTLTQYRENVNSEQQQWSSGLPDFCVAQDKILWLSAIFRDL